MTDRELLEKAAKAAGYDECRPATFGMGVWMACRQGQWEPWSPLADDGDAIRLFIACSLSIEVWAGAPKYPGGVTIVTTPDGDEFIEPHGADKFAATRRAIVRAAAAIGEGKSHG